jgi:glycerol kinase
MVPLVGGSVILSIDQGTTGTTALVAVDGRVAGTATAELPQHFPVPGWVEHEPAEIRATVIHAIDGALRAAGLSAHRVQAIGITNQRETIVTWDRVTGRPVERAIVWQDRRTSEICEALAQSGAATLVKESTGLVIDPYFSATKIAWLLKNRPPIAKLAQDGRLAVGTVDSFLVHELAGGDSAAPHVTDPTNACRTLLMDLRTLRYRADLCELFGVPASILPRIVPTTGAIAHTRGFPGLADGTPITAVAGDQQAALFGRGCHAAGDAKCTYGTGAFVLVNVGATPHFSRHGLLATVAWQLGDEVTYALEGSAFVAGAAIDWLRGLGLAGRSGPIREARDVDVVAGEVTSSEGVVFVPALAGLGAPHWDPEARGMFAGLTRGTRAAHLARATLESIALQVEDLLRAMAEDLGHSITRLRVDGGASRSDLLMQLQSDLSNRLVERPLELESTAWGAALLAGLGAGIFRSPSEVAGLARSDRTFAPTLDAEERAALWARWSDAVSRARGRLGGRLNQE